MDQSAVVLFDFDVFVITMTTATGTAATLSGNIVCREPLETAEDDVIVVRLEDVSLQDVAAKLIAEQTLQSRQAPIPFTLEYDPSRIQDRMTYAVRASIRDCTGKLLWISDTHTPVLTRGAPSDNVDICVRSVSR